MDKSPSKGYNKSMENLEEQFSQPSIPEQSDKKVEKEDDEWKLGGLIYNKDVYKNLSKENLAKEESFSGHIIEVKPLEEEEQKRAGVQFKVVDGRVLVRSKDKKGKEREKIVEQGRFLMKEPVEISESALLRGVENEEVLDSYRKMMLFKEINAKQKEGHRFNLPETVRLIQDIKGDFKILVTDETKEGKKELCDLKHYDRLEFDKEALDMIRKQVLGDLELAEENGVSMLDNRGFALDAWSVIVDKETGKAEKVMMLDVGQRVKFGAIAPKAFRKYIEKALDKLQLPIEER